MKVRAAGLFQEASLVAPMDRDPLSLLRSGLYKPRKEKKKKRDKPENSPESPNVLENEAKRPCRAPGPSSGAPEGGPMSTEVRHLLPGRQVSKKFEC